MELGAGTNLIRIKQLHVGSMLKHTQKQHNFKLQILWSVSLASYHVTSYLIIWYLITSAQSYHVISYLLLSHIFCMVSFWFQIPGLSCAKKCKTRCHSALLSHALKVELMETMSSISRPNPCVCFFSLPLSLSLSCSPIVYVYAVCADLKGLWASFVWNI